VLLYVCVFGLGLLVGCRITVWAMNDVAAEIRSLAKSVNTALKENDASV